MLSYRYTSALPQQRVSFGRTLDPPVIIEIRCRRKGMLIAAHAISSGEVPVTNDSKEFDGTDGLNTENRV